MQRPSGLSARDWMGLVSWVFVSYLAALVGSGAGDPSAYYAELTPPPGAPPGWLFGPVWGALYALMGLAAWLVWLRRGGEGVRGAIRAFWLQLVLNAAWPWLFFGARSPGLALLGIVVLLAAVGWTTVRFWRVRSDAGALLLPYVTWVLFATYLNAGFWWLNP